MVKFNQLIPPQKGSTISVHGTDLTVPDDPIIPFIRGDGTGPDIWAAAERVFNAAVEKAYRSKRKIHWFEIFAGETAFKKFGEWLPEDTLAAIKEYIVAIKGPLTTPIGGGIRSLNVTLRQVLDLYACVRPVRYFEGVPAPVKEPEKLDVVIFRENTEDVYAGIEWPEGSDEAKQIIAFLREKLRVNIREDSGLGIKPISITGTQRLIRRAIKYAIAKKRESVTMMHKGNIMKFTEGAFREWGYDLAQKEFSDAVITEKDLIERYGGKLPAGKIILKDRLADSMFQQVLLRPDEYEIIATPNLNGDYISDACAAQVGGLGMAPGGNIGDHAALFEATHGTAPKYAGLDKVNPGSLILSGVMMLEHIGWDEAAALIIKALEVTIKNKTVTYDLERQMAGAKLVKCSEFGTEIVKNMK